MVSHNKENFYGCNSIVKLENNNIIKEKFNMKKLFNNWWNRIFW